MEGGTRSIPTLASMFLVKRGVVLNQIYTMAAAVIMWQQLFIHKRQICFGVEVFGLVPPDKIAGRHTHRPENLLGVAFAPRGNLRLLPASRPSTIKRGGLSKGGFVFIDNQRPFAPGVFFDSDGCNESTGSVSWGPPAPDASWAVAPKSLSP